jgi:hypothetical protein
MSQKVAELAQIKAQDVPIEIRVLFLKLRRIVMDAHAAGISDGPIDPSVPGITTATKFGWNDVDWVVHAACHVDVLINFLFEALNGPQHVGLVGGPQGAAKLGIYDQPITNLQIYKVR